MSLFFGTAMNLFFFSNLLLPDKVVCLSIKSEYCNRKKDLLETLTLTEEKEK